MSTTWTAHATTTIMSALLSPTKPVRTRFKVPGEGAYELTFHLAAPMTRNSCSVSPLTITAAPSITSSASASASATSASASAAASTSASSASGAAAAKNSSAFGAGNPLGLSRICKMSYAPHTSLSQQQDSASISNSSSSASTGATNAIAAANAVASAASTASSLFSFRKLTALGLGKLSGHGSEEEPPPTAQPQTQPQPQSQTQFQPQLQTQSQPQLQTTGASPMHPRAPPRVASSTAATTLSSSPSHPNMITTPSSENINNYNEPPSSSGGVLAYNYGESLFFLDVLTRTTIELPLTIWARAQQTAHALALRDGILRCVIGLANGELLYFADVVAAVTSKRNRASADAGSGGGIGSGNGGGGLLSSSAASVIVGAVSNSSTGTTPPVVYNKEGCFNASRVVSLRWIPNTVGGSGNMNQGLKFAAVHADGVVVVHDARQKPGVAVAGSRGVLQTDDLASGVKGGNDVGSGGNGSGNGDVPAGERLSGLPSHRRTGSVSPATMGPFDVVITRHVKGKRVTVGGGGANSNRGSGNSPNGGTTVWQLGRVSAATACDIVEIGGGVLMMGVAGRDGYLRIVDVGREVPLMALGSYFGALLCIAWSADGRYVAGGGEDDLISIWSVAEERLVARLEGHTSWVSAVAWDELSSSLGDDSAKGRDFREGSEEARGQKGGVRKRYRLGSAGQDAKLLLWDFELDALVHRRSSSSTRGGAKFSGTGAGMKSAGREVGSDALPLTGTSGGSGSVQMRTSLHRRTGSGSGWKSGKLTRLRGGSGIISGGGTGDDNVGETGGVCTMPVAVAAPGRAEVPIVEPVVSHVAHGEPLTDVWFDERGVFTADATGCVKMWERPPQHSVPELCLGKGRASAAGDVDLIVNVNNSSRQPTGLGLGQLLCSAPNSDLD